MCIYKVDIGKYTDSFVKMVTKLASSYLWRGTKVKLGQAEGRESFHRMLCILCYLSPVQLE